MQEITFVNSFTCLKKVKERDVFDQRPVEALIMLEEKEVGKSSIYHVGVSPRQLDQIQSLLTAVPPSPEGRGVLL